MIEVIIALIVAYAVWAIAVFSLDALRKRRRVRKCGDDAATKPAQRHNEVIGASRFDLSRRLSTPQAASVAGSGEREGKEDIFAPADVPERHRQIPPEKLDALFGNVPEGETNDPLDIDFPLYEVKSFPDSEAEMPDSESENEDLPSLGRSFAQGVSFESMCEAYRHVVHNPTITDEQKQETGRVLSCLKGTDMFEAIVQGAADGGDKVQTLMDTYLAAYNKSVAARMGESLPPLSAAPPDFDIQKYV